ncbi:unnamed protein product [Aspergillus oryzae]|uniref:Unnamed protein product n=2 Tax=Aspergillus oryzae TaxID=5062 RepID=A0AAN5BXG9_ASPOZ|nr:unnamed protein product [Aspergillus oryzae]GMF97301.1 unnamed protein product [Aspergillus oryzae]GMG15632.1 unnamed protein product [Aspergillus oryzae]GMG37643.1 unnamed protein product [Aspergillus oryzae]GMG55173.1 unnamed protein product [Aspergillus oryzae var. brunneus]
MRLVSYRLYKYPLKFQSPLFLLYSISFPFKAYTTAYCLFSTTLLPGLEDMTQITCGEAGAINSHDEVHITDHDIEQLLFEAEGRLRARDVNSTNVPDTREVPDDQPQHSLLSNWFDLPQTELTPELKRDLQLLRMRSVLDPKRHYKKENGKAQPPKYSQVGTIIEGRTEFFSGRIAKKDRKKTFVEEVLDQERHNKRFESKYREIQTGKQSGKKSFYKHLQAKRRAKGK